MNTIKLAFIFLVMLVSFLPVSHAQAQPLDIEKVEITYDIQTDNSVMQTTNLYFNSQLTGSINYSLDSNVRNMEVSDGTQQLDYNLEQTVNGYNLQVFLKSPTRILTLSYVDDNIIFESDSVSHFFTEIDYSQVRNLTVQARLPAGFGIYQNSYRPSGADIVSDGQRIILIWNRQDVGTPIIFSVKFINPIKENNPWLPVGIVLAVAIVILYFYFRKKTEQAFLSGFREDEKKTIEFLKERKIAMQSDLQKSFGFSRAKSTRIIMSLEQKNLVRKQKYGRTNKLYWAESSLLQEILNKIMPKKKAAARQRSGKPKVIRQAKQILPV